MTSFVHVEYPVEHPGVARFERAVAFYRGLVRRRTEGGLLLAALVAAALVVANEVVDTWTDGHLLAAWIAMWAVTFAALALVAPSLARGLHGTRKRTARWRQARREAAEDRRLMEIALSDARVMADISRAMGAQERTAR